MRATRPHVEIPGDNPEEILTGNKWARPFIMARSGDCMGMSEHHAVWRFGFSPHSEAGNAYGVYVPLDRRGSFFWYLTKRRSGDIVESFEGFRN